MAHREEPINAGVPATRPAETKARSAPKPSPPESRPGSEEPTGAHPTRGAKPLGPTRSKPAAGPPFRGAPWAIVALVLLAAVFVAAAILGGRDGNEGTPGSVVPVGGDGNGSEGAAQTAGQLGYPGFATNNTTRVGGSDPAANAAAVALAVYPSTAPAQRPDSVALVDGESWQAAVAAAVLMAAPIRAPLLVSGPSGPPEATSQALRALDPRGSDATGGAQAFAVGNAAVPDDIEATRVGARGTATDGTRGTAGTVPNGARGAGRGPAATAAAVAALRERLAGGPPAHIVLAPLSDPGFAVPAAAWAARSGDPVLFAGRDSLPAPTLAALKLNPDVPVYVLGPTAAISSAAVRETAAAGVDVRRVSGEDPVANAIALARYADGAFGWNINDPGHGFVVARSDSPLDAALAAPLSASGTWGPLLLSDSADTLPAAMRDYLLDIKPGYTTDPTRAFYNHVWVIGDEEAIGVGQQAALDELAEVAPVRGAP